MGKKEFEYEKTYSIKKIRELLKALKYEYIEVNTLLEQDKSRYKRGKKKEFEESLKEMGIGYFVYIKFFADDEIVNEDNLYAIVVGKSGSILKNRYGSDVRFREYPQEGRAKKWLYDNNKKWYHPKILVIKAKDEEEAYKIERKLVNNFHLLES